MKRAWFGRALRVLAAIGAVAGVGVAFLGWRLGHGPLDLGRLTPVLERALSRPDGSLAVRIGTTELVWAGGLAIELRARDVRLVAGPTTVASVPALEVELSVLALLRGTVAPSEIELREPELTLVRDESGHIGLVPAASPAEPGASVPLDAPGSRAGGGPLATLETIAVRDGRLALADRGSGLTWRLRDVNMRLHRSPAGVALELAGGLEMAAAVVPIQVEGLAGTGAEGAEARLLVEPVEPASLAAGMTSPEVAGLLARLRLPLRGSLTLELDGTLQPRVLRVTAEGGRGSIAAPEIPAGEIPVERLSGQGTLRLNEHALALDDLTVALGGPKIELRGRLALDDTRALDVTVTASEASAGDVARYWPERLAPEVRKWIAANVPTGRLREGHFHVTGTAANAARPDLHAASGTIDFEAASVRLPGRLPLATDVAGKVTFERGDWKVGVARGRVAGLNVLRASVAAAHAPARRITVRTTVGGSLARAVDLVETIRPGVTSGLGVDLRKASGTVSADVETSFVPGRGGEPPLEVSAHVRDVVVPKVYRDATLASPDVQLELRGGTLAASGQGSLAGAPLSISWRESFDAGARQLEASGRIDAAARAALGADTRPWVDGPVDVRVSGAFTRGAGRIDVSADLAPAALAFPAPVPPKPAGAPAHAEASLGVAGGAVARIERVLLRTDGLELRGSAVLTPGRFRVASLDAQATVGPVPPAPRAARVALTVRPASGGRAIVLTSDDAGTVFAALGTQASATGGRLRFEATLADGAGLPFDGRLEVLDIRVKRAPLLTRLVMLASLDGLRKSLDAGGISFRAATAEISHREPVVTIGDGKVQSSEVGILVAGTIDRSAHTLDLRGSLVPSYYGLNAAGGKIPGVGKVLTGAGGEGVQVFDFAVRGPTSSPEVSLDATTAAAPGVVRDVVRRLRPEIRMPGAKRP